ncbi:hypothetical protein B0T14DRAFT_220947 [Immersiella caudata]|uniref:Uncharacterized protein n=1 Tax=Immersiella caudata TaxID=314043 RepID=A0AA39WQX8_9PEZI|nr:hypothetical protein B0T14DRAFT_220947 [Immersiella caudata]
MKYIIAYELTQHRMSFVQAIRMLGLSLDDSTELVNIVMAEHQKMAKIERDNCQREGFDLHLLGDSTDELDWTQYFKLLDDDEWPRLITDTISQEEIIPARSFLEFMGLNNLAIRLDEYQGTGSGPYEVPLNHFTSDGPGGLLPHFNVGNSLELQDLGEDLSWILPAIPGHELLVRMDAPPGTVNPRHLMIPKSPQLDDGLDWGQPVHPDNFMLYPQDPESLAQEFQHHGVRLVLYRDERNRMDCQRAAENRGQDADGFEEGPAADEDEAMESIEDVCDDDFDGRPATPGRNMSQRAASSSSDEEPFIRRSARKSRPVPAYVGGSDDGVEDSDYDPFWDGPRSEQVPGRVIRGNAMDIDNEYDSVETEASAPSESGEAEYLQDSAHENAQGQHIYPRIPLMEMDPAVAAMAHKALARAQELMGRSIHDDEEAEARKVPKLTMVTRRRSDGRSVTPSAEVTLVQKKNKTTKANKGRLVEIASDLDDLDPPEMPASAQQDDDDDWRPTKRSYVRKNPPRPAPVKLPRTPRKRGAQGGTSPDAPRSSIAVKTQGFPKAARRSNSRTAPSRSPAPHPGPNNTQFTTSSFAPPSSAPSLNAPKDIKKALWEFPTCLLSLRTGLPTFSTRLPAPRRRLRSPLRRRLRRPRDPSRHMVSRLFRPARCLG